MRRRGFTLVEIVLTVFFIGIITISIFPLFFSEAKKLRSSFSFTEAGFEAQTKIEAEIKRLNDIAYDKDAPDDVDEDMNGVKDKEEKENALKSWSNDSSVLAIDLFDAKKPIEVLAKTVSTQEKDIGTANPYKRNLVVMLPKSKGILSNSPEVTVKLTGSGNDYKGTVTYKNKPGTTKSWKNDMNFCVYRWYIGDYNKDYKLTDLTLIREYNLAKNGGNPRLFDKKTQLKPMLKAYTSDEFIKYNGIEFKAIADGPYYYLDNTVPLINEKASLEGDDFSLNDLNMLDKEENKFNEVELSALYAGKGLVFSAMPVLKSGEVGKETFSEMKKLNVPDQKLRLSVFPTYKVISALSPYPGDFRVSFLFGKLDKKYPDVDYFLKVQDLTRRKEYKLVYKRLALAYVYDSVGASMIKLDFHSDGNSTWDIFMYKKTDYEISVIQRTKDASGNYVENVIMSGKIKLPDK